MSRGNVLQLLCASLLVLFGVAEGHDFVGCTAFVIQGS